MSATRPRGQTTRDRANVQKIAIERAGGPMDWLAFHARWALSWLAWLTVQGIWAALYAPVLGGSALLLLVAVTFYGVPGLLVTLLGLGALGGLWRYRWPRSFTRHTTGRIDRFRRRMRYRASWDDVLVASGAKAVDARRRETVPRLGWVRLGDYADRLYVQLCPGITVDTLRSKSAYMVSEWGALEVKAARLAKPRGWAVVDVVYRDVLAEPTDEPEPDSVDLRRLPIGRREDGRTMALRLLGRHLLIVGSSGAGKGSVATSLLAALAPAIRAGSVRVIGIDPKGGMEFGMYPELLHMFAWRSESELVAALEAAATLATERCTRLKGLTRQHRPSTEDPYYVVLVDEVASVSAYIQDRDLKERAKTALGQLLTKGRAPGFSLVGMVQDPRKEIVDLRNLFTVSIGLRLASKSEVQMCLGETAHDQGAHCELIDSRTPGIGYIVDDEDSRAPVRFRADYRSDADMRWWATRYPSPTQEDVPELVPKTKSGASSGSKTRSTKTEKEAS